MVAQCNSTKKLKPTDIIKFGWEQQTTEETTPPSKPLTLEDVERIKAMAMIRQTELKEKGII